MTIRMTGMMSNMDTDSIIKEMMSAQSLKKTKIENKKTKLEWTMDKWKGINSKVYGFYTGSLNKVKTVGNYAAKKATSSNEALITGTISGVNASTAATGSHTISVSGLASGQFITGNQLNAGSNISKSTKLIDVGGTGQGFNKGETIKVTVGTGSDAVEKSLTVGESTTVKDFVNFLKDSGLNADFDEGQQRFSISSKESGKDNAFSITAINEDGTVSTAKNGLLAALGGSDHESVANDFYNSYSKAKKEVKDKKDYYDSIISTSATNEEKVKAYDEWKAAEKSVKDIEDNLVKYTEDQWRATFTKDAQDQVAANYINNIKADPTSADYKAIVDAVDKMYYEYDQNGNKVQPPKFSSSTLDAADASFRSKTRQEAITNINNLIASGTQYTDEAAKQAAIETQYQSIYNQKVSAAGSIAAMLNDEATLMYNESKESAFKSVGNNYVNSQAGQAEVVAIVVGKEPQIQAKGNDTKTAIQAYEAAITAGGASTYTDSLSKLGLGNIAFEADGSIKKNINGDLGYKLDESGKPILDDSGNKIKKDITDVITYVAATDAKLTFDGAEYTSSKNNITIGGVTIDIKGITTAPVTLNVTNNTENSYEMIKDFVKNYNEVLTEMSNAYYAKSAKGYDPLTSEQKKAMTDDEIDKWEKKIQDSLLRRDDTLGSLMNTMRTALQTSVTVDGQRYSLASLGITTSDDWTERGLLHIRGDSDDSYMPSATNKLQKMLEEDPELVGKIISGVTNNLYETLQKKMSTSTLSSALTFYNDKQMTKQVDEYKDQIKTWEEKLQDMEDRYYKQFSAMETALAKLNSQSSALSGLMGS